MYQCSIANGTIHPYLPSRESGKSAPQGQRQSLPRCSANENAQPVTAFRCHLVSRLLLPSLPLEPTPRRLRPPGTTCYMTATGFLHPAAPPAPRPAGYPAGRLRQLYCSSTCTRHCPAVSHCAHCLRRQSAS